MSKEKKFTSIPLSEPIAIGDKTYDAVTVRKPMPGDLRGTQVALLQLGHVDQWDKVLPRITEPTMTAEFMTGGGLETEDYIALIEAGQDFLLSTRVRSQMT